MVQRREDVFSCTSCSWARSNDICLLAPWTVGCIIGRPRSSVYSTRPPFPLFSTLRCADGPSRCRRIPALDPSLLFRSVVFFASFLQPDDSNSFARLLILLSCVLCLELIMGLLVRLGRSCAFGVRSAAECRKYVVLTGDVVSCSRSSTSKKTSQGPLISVSHWCFQRDRPSKRS